MHRRIDFHLKDDTRNRARFSPSAQLINRVLTLSRPPEGPQTRRDGEGHGMRSLTVFVAVGLMALSLAPALAARSAAQGGLPRLSVFVDGMTVDGEFVYSPAEI